MGSERRLRCAGQRNALSIKLSRAGRQSVFTPVIGHELGHTGQAASVTVVDQFAPQLAGITSALVPALEQIGLIRVALAARADPADRLLLTPVPSPHPIAHGLSAQPVLLPG